MSRPNLGPGGLAAAIGLMAVLSLPAWAQQAGGLSAQERARATPPDPWNGNWSLQRDDPRIRTRAGAATLRLQVIQDAAGRVDVLWMADRGICEDPNAPPCEWVSARGTGVAVSAGAGSLAVLLRVSADPDDTFLLLLERGAGGRVTARLVSEKGGIAYRLDAERE
jgi:hypothetical protein